MKQIVIGTAGHIDHGKTALIRALTGIDCDRLKEEKERGITIELGFAYHRFGDDLLVGIVDVPGHERFIRHMVAGAWGMDMVLFVIAADESVMPQTREHLDICELLGLRRGIIAITKSDLVDTEMIELVKEEIKDITKGRFLEDAPVIPVSAATGENVDLLRSEIRRLAGEIDERSRKGIFRLPVDRVFTIKGFGTIITGTCISGNVKVGDEVQMYPGDKRARVRNVQAYHEDVKEAGAGQRVALNLQGIEKQDIERGTIIGRPGSLYLTNRIDATLRYLDLPFKPIKNNSVLRFHIATTQVEARLILLDRPTLEPKDHAFVQFAFAEPIAVLPGDRFILRGSYAIQTLGGGTVLDIAPMKHRRQPEHLETVSHILQDGSLKEKCEYHIAKGGFKGVNQERLAVLLGVHQETFEKITGNLIDEHRAVRIGKTIIPASRFEEYSRILLSLLKEFHEKNPLKLGISKEELRTRLPEVDPTVFQRALDEAIKTHLVEADKDRVSLAGIGHKSDDAAQKLERDILTILEPRGLTPPLLAELAEELRLKESSLRDVLEKLIYQGKAVKVKADMYVATGAIEELKKTVRDQLTIKKEMLPADFKNVLGLSRKYMIPLLEYLDTIKLTIRSGDKRILRSNG
jgi:selenocysteine-specific elongation factor